MSAPDPAKIERYRERLREEWTEEATVAAWRKWQAKLSTFTRGATEAVLEAAGFTQVREEIRTVQARWMGSAEEYWQQFTEVAAPFRPLIAKLTGETRTRAESEILAGLRKLSDGSAITMPLEIVVGTGIRA